MTAYRVKTLVHSFLISAPDGGGWLVSRTGRYPPTKEPRHPLNRIRLGTHNTHPPRDDLEIMEKKKYSAHYTEPSMKLEKKIPVYYAIPRFSTGAIILRQWSLSLSRLIQLISSGAVSTLRSILILSPSTYILSSDLVPFRFWHQNCVYILQLCMRAK